MAMSPRTQALMGSQDVGTPESFFEEGFQELAIQHMLQTQPAIAEQVTAFKILSSDLDTSTAVGTFVLLKNDHEVHVPAILAENKMMPLDVMYVKSMDLFLPLSPRWIEELDRIVTSPMGSATRPPDNLQSDLDVRNVVVPPTTGRYSYASARLLPEYVRLAGEGVKKSFLKTLEKHAGIAEYVFNTYDQDSLSQAVRPKVVKEKTAATTSHIEVITIDTPAEEVQRLFREETPHAMSSIATKGYATKDTRAPETLSEAVPEERYLALQVPDSPGFYRVYMKDGTMPAALVLPKVLDLDGLRYQTTLSSESSDPYHLQRTRVSRLLLMPNGKITVTEEPFVAESLNDDQVPDALLRLLEAANPRTPRNGQRGVFVDPTSPSIPCLEPIKVDFVTLKEGVRYIQATTASGNSISITQVEGSPLKEPKAFSGSHSWDCWAGPDYVSRRFLTKEERQADRNSHDVVLVPWHYKFVPVSAVVDSSLLLRDPEAILAMFFKALRGAGAPRVLLKSAGAGLISVDGGSYTPVQVLKKLASEYNLPVSRAEELIEKIAEGRREYAFYPVNNEQKRRFFKFAQEAMAPPSGGEMSPEGVPPGAMAPPPPPPPSPIELAAREMADQVMRNSQEIQNQLITQQQNAEMQLTLLEALVQRANQIGAEMQGMDAGPPVQVPPPMPAPVASEAPPVPQEAPGGMPVEEPVAMEQAMTLEDPDMFDAAAIAELAQENIGDPTVKQFMPVFRQSLDAIGRLLIEVRMRAAEYKSQLGSQRYEDLESKLTMLLSSMGESVINLSEMASGTTMA